MTDFFSKNKSGSGNDPFAGNDKPKALGRVGSQLGPENTSANQGYSAGISPNFHAAGVDTSTSGGDPLALLQGAIGAK